MTEKPRVSCIVLVDSDKVNGSVLRKTLALNDEVWSGV